MKLGDELCPLQQAESLRRMGIAQKSDYYYYRGFETQDHGVQPAKYFEGSTSLNAAYSLFSVPELAKMLGHPLHVWFDGIHWHSNDNANDGMDLVGMTMAEAMANDLICRLTVPEITKEEVNSRLNV